MSKQTSTFEFAGYVVTKEYVPAADGYSVRLTGNGYSEGHSAATERDADAWVKHFTGQLLEGWRP